MENSGEIAFSQITILGQLTEKLLINDKFLVALIKEA